MDRISRNAVIRRTSLSIADHGLLSAWLYLDYGGAGQGFGGYNLYVPNKPVNLRNYAGHFIWRTLEVVGVTEWNELVGRTIRVRADYNGVEAIGNIIKDEWFDPAAEFKAMENG